MYDLLLIVGFELCCLPQKGEADHWPLNYILFVVLTYCTTFFISIFIFGSHDLTFAVVFYICEVCQKSSWTLMIKAPSVPEFDIHYHVSLK